MDAADFLQEYLLSKRNKDRQNRKTFDALIATPAVGSFAMPANGRLLVRSISGAAEGTLAVTITGPSSITISSIELAAGQTMFIGYIARASVVAAEADFEVLLDKGLGQYPKIATGV